MTSHIRWIFLLLLSFTFGGLAATPKLPEINPKKVTRKVEEIMRAHITHQKLSPELAKRILERYLDQLDPSKTYLLKPEIMKWLEPGDEEAELVMEAFLKSDFSRFEEIHKVMERAVKRRDRLEKQANLRELPEDVNAKDFKDIDFAESEEELIDRIVKMHALQKEAAEKLPEDTKDLAMQRIAKRRAKFQEEFMLEPGEERERFVLSNILKAAAAALDAHTAYLTPGEATQFMINVQQRLFGIGAQLRDDLNGFTLVKLIEGGPAATSGKLKAKDRIIAVNGEPVVGMDITEVVEYIRGEEGTPVDLRVVRTVGKGEDKTVNTLDITITRGEVVLKDSRIESSYEPYGDGVIAYIKLFSFYQDPEFSSAEDVRAEIDKIRQEHDLKGVVLDLRYNSGGMLSQAVAVTGLFITKGIVVSIRDSSGQTQHLRDIDSEMAWDGPLVVLVNRASASASEIVAQTLQDYGRAIIVGDDFTFGKGSFQTFTLNSNKVGRVNPEGEYKVTRGRYYTVSGRSPQLTGVKSDVVVPGALSQAEIGEQFSKYPLENDQIAANFNDSLTDVPPRQRDRIARLYLFNLQKKLNQYTRHVPILTKNSEGRIANNENYQAFLKKLKRLTEEGEADLEDGEDLDFGQTDLQLAEGFNVIKDLIYLVQMAPEEDTP